MIVDRKLDIQVAWIRKWYQVAVGLRPIAEGDEDLPDVALRDRMPRQPAEPAVDLSRAQLRQAAPGVGGGEPAKLASDGS